MPLTPIVRLHFTIWMMLAIVMMIFSAFVMMVSWRQTLSEYEKKKTCFTCFCHLSVSTFVRVCFFSLSFACCATVLLPRIFVYSSFEFIYNTMYFGRFFFIYIDILFGVAFFFFFFFLFFSFLQVCFSIC